MPMLLLIRNTPLQQTNHCRKHLFKGALRLSGTEDYAPILDLLKETLMSPAKPIVLDLRELDFLNSVLNTVRALQSRKAPNGIPLATIIRPADLRRPG